MVRYMGCVSVVPDCVKISSRYICGSVLAIEGYMVRNDWNSGPGHAILHHTSDRRLGKVVVWLLLWYMYTLIHRPLSKREIVMLFAMTVIFLNNI